MLWGAKGLDQEGLIEVIEGEITESNQWGAKGLDQEGLIEVIEDEITESNQLLKLHDTISLVHKFTRLLSI